MRNISDPVVNAELPFDVVKEWSLALYGACGLYSSYNGALCSWSLIGT